MKATELANQQLHDNARRLHEITKNTLLEVDELRVINGETCNIVKVDWSKVKEWTDKR